MSDKIPELVIGLRTDPYLMEEPSNYLLTMTKDLSLSQGNLLCPFHIFSNNIDPSACFTPEKLQLRLRQIDLVCKQTIL